MNGRTNGHHFIRVQIVQGRAIQKRGYRALHMRHAGRAAHHHHALNVFCFQTGIAQGFFHSLQGFLGECLSTLFKVGALNGCGQQTIGERCTEHRMVACRKLFFAGAGSAQQQTGVHRVQGLTLALFKRQFQQTAVVIITAQGRVAAGGQDLEHTTAHAQNGNIKGAAAQVIDRINTFAGIVQTIGNGGSSGFVDQAQHIQTRHLSRIFGGLALRIVKVGGHGDDRAVDVVIERVFCALAQAGQNLGTHLHR